MEDLKERIELLFPQLVEWRRNFHKYPELSFQEARTSQQVAEFLRGLGLEVRTGIGGYGVTGLLRGKEPGPTVALRSDMDALPIQDEKTCEYRSQVPGVMHACGHDGHMAMLMGTALLLTEMKESLKGNVLFLFQHAEELLPGGAVRMVEEGVLKGVDVIYGIHLWSPMPTGVVGIREGELMAAADSFEVEITGKGGHGALPHEAVDAVAIASHAVVNLQTIISRQLDPLKSGVITVGTIEGGQAFNVIAEKCRLTGTVRSFDPGVREQLARRMEEVIQSTCQMYGADYRFNYLWGYPPVVNDSVEARRLAEVARQINDPAQVWEIMPVMAAEDFAYYLQQRKGAFCFVGAGNTDLGITAPHHHPKFDIDEKAMKTGVELFIETTLHYLQENSV
ncbi:M20 family metallopeptidase [Paenactinomyces guangxiensis]|uniref:Amidohydrolase n=1 Tax=Paenactinomyces guangxiensis TaxID=1490290 RepID=A0A7W2A6U3_9BACL|nr:M20 family metallopeptidase [Paenactinomyces guangxiensis]MBA4492890.1 amidohydrolase [Paenactinomyces guangxiensis]MBH8590262.1 amidohydrolase [Paenactinomyces guangxiensis]